jgi:hypothetical protein
VRVLRIRAKDLFVAAMVVGFGLPVSAKALGAPLAAFAVLAANWRFPSSPVEKRAVGNDPMCKARTDRRRLLVTVRQTFVRDGQNCVA